jgi:hypothetical protein
MGLAHLWERGTLRSAPLATENYLVRAEAEWQNQRETTA